MDLALDGHLITGPVQSRPDWERRAVELDGESRRLWTEWADSAFRAELWDVSYITANADEAAGNGGDSITV